MLIIPRKSTREINSYLRQDVDIDSYLRQNIDFDCYLRQDVEINSYFSADDLAQHGTIQATVDGKILITKDGKKRRVFL